MTNETKQAWSGYVAFGILAIFFVLCVFVFAGWLVTSLPRPLAAFLLALGMGTLVGLGGIVWTSYKAAQSVLDLNQETDLEANAAEAWSVINETITGAPTSNFDTTWVCEELSDLRLAGWTIRKTGNPKSGKVTLTFKRA